MTHFPSENDNTPIDKLAEISRAWGVMSKIDADEPRFAPTHTAPSTEQPSTEQPSTDIVMGPFGPLTPKQDSPTTKVTWVPAPEVPFPLLTDEERLTNVVGDIAHAEMGLEEAKADRDRIIREMAQGGVSGPKLAKLTGLSTARIYQIIKEAQ